MDLGHGLAAEILRTLRMTRYQALLWGNTPMPSVTKR
jgi:hypothetical protein